MEICNLQCLEDLALRLLCVFALDRFGDYLSDEVLHATLLGILIVLVLFPLRLWLLCVRCVLRLWVLL